MANVKITCRLSAKKNELGKSEILLRVCTSGIFMRAKSGIYVIPNHFAYEIDYKANQKNGQKVPAKLTMLTEEDAVKRGIDIKGYGDIVINERMETPAVLADREAKIKLDMMKAEIINQAMSMEKDDLTDVWLKNLIGRYNSADPENYVGKAENESATPFFDLAKQFVDESDYKRSCYDIAITTFRSMYRMQVYKPKFVWDVRKTTEEDIMALKKFIQNEADIIEDHPNVFKDINSKFPTWMIRIQKRKVANNSLNSVNQKLRALKRFFTWAYKRKFTKAQPFQGVTISDEKLGKPICLSLEEREHITTYNITDEKLCLTRDIFYLQSLIGCRVSDLFVLTWDNIDQRTNYLHYYPIKTEGKTDAEAKVYLSAAAWQYLEKFSNGEHSGRLVPSLSFSEYDLRIKETFELMHSIDGWFGRSVKWHGLQQPLYKTASSHLARRTFANILYQAEPNKNIIAQMTGHVRGSKAFDRYHEDNDEAAKKMIIKTQGTNDAEVEAVLSSINTMTAEQREAIKKAILNM